MIYLVFRKPVINYSSYGYKKKYLKLSKEACEIFDNNSFVNYRFIKQGFKKLIWFPYFRFFSKLVAY